MQYPTTPWWQSELYTVSSLLPPVDLTQYAGPMGPAYVQVFPDGTTASGWGEKSFIQKYTQRAFHSRRAQAVYDRHQTPFALVMRSVRLVAIDIDGKNGGIESAAALLLPPTLAETSKSGQGFHLFYLVDDTWDPRRGFAGMPDRIGFVEGVDFRGTGCVFHYPTQQWNNRQPAMLPDHIKDRLVAKSSSLEHNLAWIKQVRDTDDEVEILMMQEHVKSRLTAPIPKGRRNNTLFAIGAEMHQAQVPNWEEQVYNRAIEVGLDDAEATKLVGNIRRYGS